INAAAAVNLAATIGVLDFLGGLIRSFAAGAVVLQERLVLVVALDQPSAGRVVMRDSEKQRAAFLQRKLRLHQPFAERGFAHHERAVMILQSAGDDLGSRS